ncbi:fungal specific transcription factor, putative [Talaromyces stipitatus ATCC 10500]|uniref:Fungal specific transcription factor, putative n=1 Tax=Talaromyces stipitatus (strain ATCC 10500 / CBS 375.48 / QM 6759 / NRRL 1006) TaxID=441959 RepID=B8MPM1_TALSN|nr:fungal specific transcription factor, putative [Talaromyces stipitatus ATCC 10500]EED14460.1 fungal specific transcription factor, putative [Talaromyces stipitatus ATCC 10500]
MGSPQGNEDHEERSSLPRRPRLRIANACQACRLRKVKCDGVRPDCSRCLEKRKQCVYIDDPFAVRQQTKRKSTTRREQPIRSHAVSPTSASVVNLQSIEVSTIAGPSYRIDDPERNREPTLDQERAYYTPHAQFSGEVEAAVDDRAGLAPSGTSNFVPFVDAPLFGDLVLHSPGSDVDLAKKLPPRAYADRLVGVYWQHVHPIEPVLDRDQFLLDYDGIYNTPLGLAHEGRTLRLSILNLVFALAVQRQELTPLQQRNEEGNGYFQRAWSLLPPDTAFWKPGSLELVQCLMLMNRYLHCTTNRQKTWMTAGFAMRIAQSLQCYLAYDLPSGESSNEERLKRQIWTSCVGLDRCVSWSLGTISTLFPVLPSHSAEGSCSISSTGNQQLDKSHVELLHLELYEIGNQIQLAQTQSRNIFAAKLGLPRPYQQEEYHAVAVQLDACLDKWENRIPSKWKLQELSRVVDRETRTHGYLLHVRLLLHRMFLFRPMLARVYSTRSHLIGDQAAYNRHSLSDRIIKDCAMVCVESAQKLTKLIIDTLEPHEPMGLLPWWYRIYYLHIAGTNFLASMFSPDLFTQSVSQSWGELMSALRAHEHLSTYVQQCIRTFEMLSTRITQTRNLNMDNSNVLMENQGWDYFSNDIFQDLGLNFDNFLFGGGVMIDVRLSSGANSPDSVCGEKPQNEDRDMDATGSMLPRDRTRYSTPT